MTLGLGVSFVELLILYERWAGERLVLEMSVPKIRRFNLPISVSTVPAGPSIDIWRSCRFWGAMLRALGGLPGGLGRFIPCRLGANHCRLRSIGWERCGHGLTSRPLEATGTGFLDDLLSLFGYLSGSGQFLVDGSLGCGTVLLNFLVKSLLGGCRTLVAWLFWFLPLILIRRLLVCRVLVMSLALETLTMVEERRYDLPKRLMCVSVLELILGSSQFPTLEG